LDRLLGLELGADDYVTKPFSPRVLLARMKSVLRRRPAEPSDRIILDDGNLIIDPARHETRVDGKTVDLTLTQYEILHYLARRPGFVRTRQQIVSAVRGDDTILSGRAIDVHVAGLRQKLKGHGRLIETVRGVGYRIAERLDEASSD
ncbi:MAG: response regulator transcription factor, partial [Phycisphaerales bacterium]|nr:response regulator transcription factor [Phycisphaerales bacterium]